MSNIEGIDTGCDLDTLLGSLDPSSPTPAAGITPGSSTIDNQETFQTPDPASSVLFSQQSLSINQDGEDLSARGHEPPRLQVTGQLPLSKPNAAQRNTINPQSLPRDAIARRFVDAYFRNTNRAYPFVDRAKILRGLESMRGIPGSRNDTSSTLLYLIMAIGCTTLQRAGQIPNDTTSKFDIAYAAIIQECIGREDTESIQILLLLALYSLFDPNGASAWSIIGIVSRKALLLGLSRKISEEKSLSAADIELRHRLFWSIYVFDRMMAVSLGYSVALVDDNVDVSLPSLTIDEFASTEKPYFASILQTNRHVIQLRQLEDRILREIHLRKSSDIAAISRTDRRAIQQDIRSNIEGWYSTGCLVSSLEADNLPIHNSVTWQSARYYHLLILLYYPCQFNSFVPIPGTELLRFAQKHLQSTSALFQQRQLPLNQVTLCRMFPVGLVLLHSFAASALSGTPFAAREEVAVVINILEAFSEGWIQAHRAAHIFRQFMAIIAGVSGEGPLHLSAQLYGSFETGMSKDLYRELLRPIMNGFLAIMQEVLGATTCYCFYEMPDERDLIDASASTARCPPADAAPLAPTRASTSFPAMPDADASSMNYDWGSGEFTFI